MKKLIYIFVLFFTISTLSQEVEKNSTPKVDITSISAYPNPFNIKTNINFYSSTETAVSFTVQNLLGNVVQAEKILLIKGKNTIPFYRNKLTAGIYIYTFRTENKVISKRFVIK